MSTLDVTNLKSKLALTPTKFYDKDDVEVGTLCRAWVNFDGTTNTGGYCTIRSSFNVSSVTDNNTGDYTINFTNAMPDANYSASGMAWDNSNNARVVHNKALNTTTFRIIVRDFGYSAFDSNIVMVQVFR